MPRLALPAAALLTLLAASALAHTVTVSNFEVRDPMRWATRHETRAANAAITTRDGMMTLLLVDRSLAIQLSDNALRKVDRDLQRERQDADDDGSVLGDAIRSAVMGAVRSLLDHSAECPFVQIRDVRYEGGRIVVESLDGERLFDGLDVNDQEAMAAFAPADARAFVREYHRLAARR